MMYGRPLVPTVAAMAPTNVFSPRMLFFKNTVKYIVFRGGHETDLTRVWAIIPVRWNVKRDVRASIGAYGGGNGAYERVFTEKVLFPKHCKIQCFRKSKKRRVFKGILKSSKTPRF